jgi:hypothetical protein
MGSRFSFEHIDMLRVCRVKLFPIENPYCICLRKM